jgi:PmbA protein
MKFEDIAEIVTKASEGDEIEVVALEQNESLTRFANNHIHQNVTELDRQITVRSVIGTRVGTAVTNDARVESLRELARRAAALARLQPENPDFKGLPGPQLSIASPVADADAFDEEVAICGPEERARRVAVVCEQARTAGYTAAGSMTTGTVAVGVANSKGVLARRRSTIVDASTVVMSSTSSGWAQSSGWRLRAVDWNAMAQEAIGKARLGENPADIDPGTFTVVLDPYAVADLLEMLAYDGMSALAVQEERSWLNGRIGRKIMAESVTIVDDGLDREGIPVPFDFEGTPKQVVPIVEKGIARGPVYDSLAAGREVGKRSTGHAGMASAEGYGPLPGNLFMRCGTSNVNEMIRSTQEGLYITRFWYTRVVHPREVLVTGMTRDGTFVIRNGEIAHAAKSLRFTQSYVDALLHTEAIGSVAKALRVGFGTMVVPAVKLAQFRFTSRTR